MSKKIQEYFLGLSAIVLFVMAGFLFLTAIASHTRILDRPDPFLILHTRILFYVVGGLQLGMSAFLLMSRRPTVKLALVAWAACNALVYSFGMARYEEPNLFVCLGNLTDLIPIAPKILNSIATIILGSLLVGSCSLLIWNWFCHRATDAVKFNAGVVTPDLSSI